MNVGVCVYVFVRMYVCIQMYANIYVFFDIELQSNLFLWNVEPV